MAQSIKNLPAMQETTCNTGNPGSIPRLGRFPGEGNGNPLEYSCLKNPMDGGVWWPTVRGVTRVRHNLVTKPYTYTNQTHTQTIHTHIYFPPFPHLTLGHHRVPGWALCYPVTSHYLIVYIRQHYFLNSSHPYLPHGHSPFSRSVSPFLPCK